MIIAGILAGGKGSRMNSSLPKQFIKIDDIPILIRTINKFLPYVDKVIVATNEDYLKETKIMLKDIDKAIIILGGKERFNSLINIVNKAYEIDKNSIVMIHDAARPFIPDRVIKEHIEKIKDYDALTTSIPTIDTIVVVENGIEKEVPNREIMYLDQGVQTIKSKQFIKLKMIDNCIEVGRLYLANKLKVGVIMGDRLNFKITNQIDLEFSEYLIEKGIL